MNTKKVKRQSKLNKNAQKKRREDGGQEVKCPPIDWSKVTPYDVIRATNCKMTNFRNKESYPSIRPPISLCSNQQTMWWLADAVKATGCCRGFGTDPGDDLVEVWKQTPNKDKLGFYGIKSNIPGPDVQLYNDAVEKSLKVANGVEEKKDKKEKPDCVKKDANIKMPEGGFTLNRCVLSKIVNAMPTVTKKLNAKNAHTWLQCPEPDNPEYPFLNDGEVFDVPQALDMKRPEKKQKHGLRRKHKYCELQCGIPENKCTAYEWMKYRQDPMPYEVAFKMEMAQEVTKPWPEPRNYDELYYHLLGSFQQARFHHDDCKKYHKCCLPKWRRYSKGCKEFIPATRREYSSSVLVRCSSANSIFASMQRETGEKSIFLITAPTCRKHPLATHSNIHEHTSTYLCSFRL